MVDIEAYISALTQKLRDHFGARLSYVGLQGSYLRGEATESSDLDIMVVIDGLSLEDMENYRAMIQSLDHAEKSCGFICSREDLRNWNPLEICNLLHSTKDYHGELSGLVPACTRDDIRNFIKFSVNNLYHEICHRFIHGTEEANVNNLPFTYKGVFFILQNLYYLENGEFIRTKGEMLHRSQGIHKEVLQRSLELNRGGDYDFRESLQLLFAWCQFVMANV